MTIKVKPFTQPTILYVLEERNPTSEDIGYPILTIWLNELTSNTFQLVNKSSGATWAKFSGGSTSGSKIESWDPTETYAVDDIVNDDGILYVSILGSINKKPSANPLFWTAYSQTLVMTTITDPAINEATSTANIDDYSGVIITLTISGNDQTLQDPTDVTPGKKFTVAVYSTDSTSTIEVNNITLSNREAQTFVWSGSTWMAVEAVDAEDISFTPTPTITSTDVQAAIVEVGASVAIKADKIVPAAVDNLSALDATGNLADSGKAYPVGDIVGTSDAQALTNKTINGDLNNISNISLGDLITDSTDVSKFIIIDSAGNITHIKDVPTGDIIGSSDAQVLSNKTINSSTGSFTTLQGQLVNTQLINVDHEIQITEFGTSLRADSTSEIEFTFASLGAAQDGAIIRICKINLGKVTITPPGGKYIDDKVAGVSTYNDTDETYATLTLEYIHEIETLVFISARGSWF